MGCFFGCFRTRDDRHLPKTQQVSNSTRSKSGEAVISRNRLSSLFLSEEKEGSPCNDRVNFGLGSQGDDKGLKEEAKFLKTYGTLAGTPAEIQKASGKLKVSPSCGKDSEPSKFHSWLPKASVEKPQRDVQPFNPPTPKNRFEEWEKGTDSLEHTPSSCISNAYTQRDSIDSTEGSRTGSLQTTVRTCAIQIEKNGASASPSLSVTDIQKRHKSVRFKCDSDLSSSGSSSEYGGQHTKRTGSPYNQSACEASPYPTPLKLSDEMQTPGTVCPATLELSPHGELRDSLDKPQNSTPTPEDGSKRIPYEKESNVEGSLSSWLKPAAVIREERKKRMETAYSQISHVHKTPADRPIIGMVAAHWNEDDDNHIHPPKWWDGNGIPNSTNKYKEDQKVSWHATPFEERLEKALSEESVVTERNHICGKPIVSDEHEESDTALSQLQSSTHPQSVVSF